MPRPPKPENVRSPLRTLRGLLSEKGEEEPISREELAKIVEVSPYTIRSIENAQRALTGSVMLQIGFSTGALWDDELQQWVCNEALVPGKVPFSRDWYTRWKNIRTLTKEPLSMLVPVFITRLFELSRQIRQEDRFRFAVKIENFLQECRKEFGTKGKAE